MNRQKNKHNIYLCVKTTIDKALAEINIGQNRKIILQNAHKRRQKPYDRWKLEVKEYMNGLIITHWKSAVADQMN